MSEPGDPGAAFPGKFWMDAPPGLRSEEEPEEDEEETEEEE